MLLCSPCSSKTGEFVKANLLSKPSFAICGSYCQRMYEACRFVPIEGTTLVQQKYANGEAFCKGEIATEVLGSFSLEIKDTECFNAAPERLPIGTLVMILITMVTTLLVIV